MIKFAGWMVAAFALSVASGEARAQKVVYLVRHAEKAPPGAARIDAWMPLSPFGVTQAALLADELSGENIGAIYGSRFDAGVGPSLGPGRMILRTRETAAPLIQRLRWNPRLEEIEYPESLLNWDHHPEKMIPFAERAVVKILEDRKGHPDETILIVGHENTVPALIRQFAAWKNMKLPADSGVARPEQSIRLANLACYTASISTPRRPRHS